MVIIQDFKANRGNSKGFIFIFFFRISHFFQNHGYLLKLIGIPIRLFYKIVFRWIFGIDIPDNTEIGIGFQVYHGIGLIIHDKCIIGKNVLIRHNTTLGEKKVDGGAPRIGDNVQIGAHCLILGDISIGHNCIIGAGSFIDKDLPANSKAYGNPLRIMPIIHQKLTS